MTGGGPHGSREREWAIESRGRLVVTRLRENGTHQHMGMACTRAGRLARVAGARTWRSMYANRRRERALHGNHSVPMSEARVAPAQLAKPLRRQTPGQLCTRKDGRRKRRSGLEGKRAVVKRYGVVLRSAQTIDRWGGEEAADGTGKDGERRGGITLRRDRDWSLLLATSPGSGEKKKKRRSRRHEGGSRTLVVEVK